MYILVIFFFFFNDTATTEIYTLSLHDALPISSQNRGDQSAAGKRLKRRARHVDRDSDRGDVALTRRHGISGSEERSEEHTSELQSHLNLVCRLLLEKKKQDTTIQALR